MILPNLPMQTRFKKTVALLVALSFLFSNVVFADIPKNTNPDSQKASEIITDPAKIIVPRDYGLIKSRYAAKDSKKLIIHIQDAHCNYEAQSNIIKILECLIKNDGLRLVSVEGADGFIDTSWFKAFPDADIRKEVADYFMKKGEITGPEYLSITSDYPIKLFGAETRSDYIDNLNAFTSSYPLKEDTERYFNQIKTVINKLKNYIYSEELKELDTRRQDYEAKSLSFTDYVKYLEKLGEKHRVNLRQYDNLFKLISVLIYEKKINFNVVDKERSALIDVITKKLDKEKLTELVNKSLEFKVGKIASAEYYDYLKGLAVKHGISLSAEYPNLFNYIIYNSVYSRIENESLFNDIKKFEEAVKEKVFANDDQRTLDKLSRHINILIGLVNIKLLNGDFDYYKSHKEEFAHEAFADFIKKMTTRYGFAYEVDAPSEAVTESMPKLDDFYAIAIKRDKALVDNTIQAMRKEDVQVSVLVTGGFHSEGITKLLEKQNISYIVVCPNITKDVETPYIKILTNQRTPLEEILSDSAVTADTKNVKGGMLAPYLITAARIHIRELKKLKEISERTEVDLREWTKRNIVPWLPKAKANIEKKGLSFTEGIAVVTFGLDVDKSVERYIERVNRNKQLLPQKEIALLKANAKDVKELAKVVILQILASQAVKVPTPNTEMATGNGMFKLKTTDGCIIQNFVGQLSNNDTILTLSDKSGKVVVKINLAGKAKPSSVKKTIKEIEQKVAKVRRKLGKTNKKIIDSIIEFLKLKADEKRIYLLDENPEGAAGFADNENIFVSKHLADNPIALFHEGGEGYFAANAEQYRVLEKKGIAPHTYLRGIGYKNRVKVGHVRSTEFRKVERRLIKFYKGLGLQDIIFGVDVNDEFSREIALIKKIDPPKALGFTVAVLTQAQKDLIDSIANALGLKPIDKKYLTEMWAQYLLRDGKGKNIRPLKEPLKILMDPSRINDPDYDPEKEGNFILSAMLPPKEEASKDSTIPPYRFKYSELIDDTTNASYAKENVIVTISSMDGGIGENIKRKRSLAREKGIPESAVTDSAKGIDLYFHPKPNAPDWRISIAEAKLLQLILTAKKFNAKIRFQPLVGEKSKASYQKLLFKTPCILDPSMTYKKYLEKKNGIIVRDMVKQGNMPSIDANGNISLEVPDESKRQPGGHGQFGFRFLYEAYRIPELEHPDKTEIRVFYNGDNINSRVSEHIAGKMARSKLPIVKLTTAATPIDRKGGKDGYRIVKSGKTILLIPDQMELADAKAANRTSPGQLETFYNAGLDGGSGRKGDQPFNTNIFYINMSVLHPILEALVESDLVTEDKLYDIISPLLIDKQAYDKTTRRKYRVIDGAIGTAIHNLNAFVIANMDDSRMRDILDDYGIDRILYFVDVPRTEFFTPVKQAPDMWLQDCSDYYTKLDTNEWALHDSEDNLTPPGFDLQCLGPDGKETYWDDLENLRESLGTASTKRLKSLTIRGMALLKDAQLKGDIVIINRGDGLVDLNQAQPLADLKSDNVLGLNNVSIVFNPDGSIYRLDKYIKNLDKLAIYANIVEKNINIGSENVDPLHYSAREEEGEEDTYSISKDGIQLGRLVFVKRDPPDPDPGTWEFRPASIPGAITVNIDPKKLPPIAKQLRYVKNAATEKPLKVVPGDIPSETRGSEHSFAFMIKANEGTASALGELADIQNKLQQVVPHHAGEPNKLYVSGADTLHIALGGKYSDILGTLTTELIEKAVANMKDAVAKQGAAPIVITLNGLKITDNGAIVLDIVNNPDLARLRALVRDAMIKAGWDKDIVKVLTVNNEPSPSGVLTIARIVPTEKGGKVPMLMSEAELESLKKEVSRINEGLKEKPITINLNTISFSSPTGEFHSGVLENEQKIPLTGPGVGAIRMKYGGLTTAEHGTRRYGHLDLKLTPKRLKALIKALMTEKTINGAVGRLIKSGNSAYAISKNGIHLEGDIDIEPLLIPTGDKTLASLQKSLDSLGINFIVIKGLKKELGVPKDLVFHYGVTRKSVYIDEEDFNYLLSLENGVELILQGARHEVAHIDNPDLSEVEIEKLAPSYDVRIALTLRDVNSKRDKMNIVQQRFIEGQEYEGIGKYYKPLEKFAKFGTSGVRWLVKGAADVLAKLPERVSYYISNDYKRTVDGEEVLAEDFNMPNVSIVIKSIALYNLQKAQGIHPVISGSTEEFKKRLFGKGLLVMYDNRPGNFENAQQTARILAAYGIKVVLTKSDNNYNVPTPLPAVSRLVTIGGYAGSITFTASHNGDEWNGIKFEGEDGGAASPKITDAIGAILTEELALKNPEKPVEYDMTEEDVETLIKQGKVATIDTLEFYVEEVAKYLDIEAIKKAIKDRRVKLVYSAFFGSSGPAMVKLFQKMGLPTDNITDNIIETEKSADQGYVASYEPTLEKLEKLMATVRARGEEIKEKNLKTVVIGGSADNDADRFQVNQYNRTTGEVEEFTPEKLAAVLGHYLYKYRRFKGPMGRSFVTGSLQDEVAKLFGEDTVETAVGFKFSPKVFVEKGGILFTEESYGLSFQRWTLDKDGILPSLLALELVAVTGKSLDEYYRDVLNELEKAGLASNKYFKRYDQALDEKVKQKAIERFTEFFNGTNNISFGGQKIIKWYNPKEYDNGMKFVLADGSWVAFRSSGTEPIIKIYIEARSEAERDMLREEAFKLIGISDLDLSGVSGLPIILRQKTGEIILEGTLISEHRWSRPLKDAGNSIANPSAINESNGSREVYYGYRNVVSRPHAAKVDEQKLRFDITVLMPGLIDEKNDREFIMTKGHMHVVAVEGPIQPSSHPEFYEVWNGQAIYIQQGVNPQSGKFEVIATYAKAGDKVLLLPGYSHRTINIGNVPLVMANWISHEVGGKRKRVEGDERYVAVPKEEEVIPGNAKANFAEIEKNNGYAYWVMRTPDGRIEFVYNPNYGVIPPQIRFTTAVKEIPRFNLSNQEPMYSQFRNATLAKFLNNSSGFEDVYNEAFNLVEETPAVTVPAIFDHTVESIMQSSDTGERVRKAAETKFKEEGKDIGKKHLIFVKSAIPEKQLATTTAINLANFCEDYYNEMDGYSAHIVDSYEKAVELLAKNPDWDKNNTIVGLINAQDLDKMSAALEKNAMKGKAKLLAMEKFNEDQFVPIKGFFDLMSVLVRINRPLDRDKDRELLDGIRDLLSEIGVRDINRLVDALSAGGYFEDPIKFAKNFILRLLPPTKPRDAKELKQLYDAVKKVIESL